MASVNFEKIKQNGKPISAYMRHNDSEERKRHTHKNQNIDTDKTDGNLSWKGLNCKQCEERYKKRIEELDEIPGQNKRKDRVTCFSLELPIPKEVETKEAFFNDVMQLFERKYGTENICQGILHVDEVHDYVDHGEVKTSLEHIHCLVIPEIDGKLNGKKFSSKEAMIKVNSEIEQLCREKYHCSFMTGEKPRHKTVEELKVESEKEKEMLKTLSDKEPVSPQKVGWQGKVTYTKEDNNKLVLFANMGMQSKESNDRLNETKAEIEDKYRTLQKEKSEAAQVIEQAAKHKKLSEKVPLLQEMDRELTRNINKKNAELDTLTQRINEQKELERGGLKFQSKLATLEAENGKLKDENNRLKAKISNFSRCLNQIYKESRGKDDFKSKVICQTIERIQKHIGKNDFNHNIERNER